MMWAIIQVVFAWLYGHTMEWIIHRYILHNLGKKRHSVWSFHFREHHAICRKNENVDSEYQYNANTIKCNRVGKEFAGLIFLALIHAPLLPIAPWFVLTVWASIIEYYYLHRKSHIDIEWGKKNMRWHYDHHMGKNQHMNWGVRSDFIDRILGTKVIYEEEKPKDLNDKVS